LNHRELATYAHRVNSLAQEADIAALLHSSEGWFSAVYLNLCFLAEQGTLPDKQSDIYEMFFNALIDPLPPQRQEFLAVMGLADEFSAEMARFITRRPRD
ncbi:MAG: LuxR family transcriptional regulator, partial [Oscillospiraceae bacterium]